MRSSAESANGRTPCAHHAGKPCKSEGSSAHPCVHTSRLSAQHEGERRWSNEGVQAPEAQPVHHGGKGSESGDLQGEPEERLMGFEPSTFCMASSTCGAASAEYACKRHVSRQRGPTVVFRHSRGNHGSLGSEWVASYRDSGRPAVLGGHVVVRSGRCQPPACPRGVRRRARPSCRLGRISERVGRDSEVLPRTRRSTTRRLLLRHGGAVVRGGRSGALDARPRQAPRGDVGTAPFRA